MKFHTRPVWIIALGLAIASLGLGGCENKLTKENYDKIQVGMSLDEVTAILGPGEKMVDGGASKLAKDMLGDITMAQQRQNQNQIKQGLGDLVKNREEQTQREAQGGGALPKPAGASPQQSSSGAVAKVPAAPPPPPQRAPVRDRWIWKGDHVEITVDFSDDRVTTKNQDGL